LESKKDATASPLRVLRRIPLQREDRFADDRAMRVAAGEASREALANNGQSRDVGYTRTGAELCEGW